MNSININITFDSLRKEQPIEVLVPVKNHTTELPSLSSQRKPRNEILKDVVVQLQHARAVIVGLHLAVLSGVEPSQVNALKATCQNILAELEEFPQERNSWQVAENS